MPSLGVAEYVKFSVRVAEGTDGGDTFYLDGRPVCFWWSRQHKDAVLALTDGKSWDVEDVVPAFVDSLVASGVVRVAAGPRPQEWGLLGAKVYDEEGVLIGEVGRRCGLDAGFGTDHKGFGRCHFHDVSTGGKETTQRRRRIKEKIAAYAQDPQIGSIEREIAVLRVVLDLALDHLEEMEDDPDLSLETLKEVATIAGEVGKQVDRATKIEQRYALSAGQVAYLEAAVRDILRTYVDPKLLDTAVEDLRQRLGGQEIGPKRLRG